MNRPQKRACRQRQFSVNRVYIVVNEKDSSVRSLDVSPEPVESIDRVQSHWLAPLIAKRFRTSINVPWNRLNLEHLTDFQQDVIQALDTIPAGTTIDYGTMADKINRSNAARAVGQALKQNPYPVLLPCHRVIRYDGSVGGYGGTTNSSLKHRLLSLEGVDI